MISTRYPSVAETAATPGSTPAVSLTELLRAAAALKRSSAVDRAPRRQIAREPPIWQRSQAQCRRALNPPAPDSQRRVSSRSSLFDLDRRCPYGVAASGSDACPRITRDLVVVAVISSPELTALEEQTLDATTGNEPQLPRRTMDLSSKSSLSCAIASLVPAT